MATSEVARQATDSFPNRLHASPVLPSGQRLPQSGLHAARSASARSGVLLRHDLPHGVMAVTAAGHTGQLVYRIRRPTIRPFLTWQL